MPLIALTLLYLALVVPCLRWLVRTAEREGRSMPANWVPFERENEGGKVTHGWAVPMGEAFKAMVYRTVVQLPGGRR